MKKEDKDLLLKDLSARLPYGIIVQQSPKYADKHFADKWETEPHDFNIIGIIGKNTLVTDRNITERTYAKGIMSKPVTICIYDGLTKQTARPYLRPMSSMTEGEYEEYKTIVSLNAKDNIKGLNERISGGKYIPSWFHTTDWFNKKMFDYRGLIPMGLALEAPEDVYRNETEK